MEVILLPREFRTGLRRGDYRRALPVKKGEPRLVALRKQSQLRPLNALLRFDYDFGDCRRRGGYHPDCD